MWMKRIDENGPDALLQLREPLPWWRSVILQQLR